MSKFYYVQVNPRKDCRGVMGTMEEATKLRDALRLMEFTAELKSR